MPIISTATHVVLNAHRRCPKCHKAQMVAPSKVHAAVKCRYCGADIPPPRK